MNSSNLLKGGVVVIILLASLAVFDAYGTYANNSITGAYYIYGLESEDAATDQTAKCPATITVSSNKQTDYSQGETAVFTITMRDAAGNIVKRGASLGISSATATPRLMFGKAFPATESGIIIVEVPLTASIYPAGAYAVQVSSEAGDCSPVESGQSLAVQAATGQTVKCPARINVEVNSKNGFYYDGDTATFSIRMYDEEGNIVKSGASLVIRAAEEPSVAKFAVNMPATESGVITVSVPLRKYEYLPSKSYLIKASAEPSGFFGGTSSCPEVYSDATAFTFNEKQASATGQTTSNPAQPYKVDANSMDLYPGWNLISVTPPMVGKSLAGILNQSNKSSGGYNELEKFPYACVLEGGAWLWDGSTQKYQFVNSPRNTKPPFANPVDKFSSDHVGLGLWVYVLQDEGCRFGCGTTGCLPET